MTFAPVLTMRYMGLAAFLSALGGCADGSGFPTGPSATPSASVQLSSATDDAVATSSSSPRSGALLITKECSEFDGTNGTFCTITSSNLAAIEVGSRVIYATVSGFGDLDSDVVLDLPGPGNNAAFGHCTLTATVSRCTFAGGTGKFTHFQADVAVSYLGGVDYGWDGTYTFRPHD